MPVENTQSVSIALFGTTLSYTFSVKIGVAITKRFIRKEAMITSAYIPEKYLMVPQNQWRLSCFRSRLCESLYWWLCLRRNAKFIYSASKNSLSTQFSPSPASGRMIFAYFLSGLISLKMQALSPFSSPFKISMTGSSSGDIFLNE